MTEQRAEEIVDPDEYDEEPITMECPECGLTGDVPGVWEGLQIECKECAERFIVSSVGTDTDRPSGDSP